MFNLANRKRDLVTVIFIILVIFAIKAYLPDVEKSRFTTKTWVEYKNELTITFNLLWENHSLGMTKDGSRYEAVVIESFTRSLKIITTSFLLALFVGMAKGIYDFRKRKFHQRIVGEGLTGFLSALPDFFLILCVQWGILFYLPFIPWFGHDEWYSFILPSLLVALYPFLYVAKITSASLNEKRDELFVSVAKSKGFVEKVVVHKHLLRSSLPQIFSHIPSMMIYILSNLLIVEWLTSYKGAAFRLFYSIDKKVNVTQIPGINADKMQETGLIIEIALCFMAVYFAGIMISKILLTVISPFHTSSKLIIELLKQIGIFIGSAIGMILLVLYII
ncbi:ABC transporter permease subunit [Ferdinandcohnia quinoae]|uniref:ABC transporter permease subunit n=1 Tax=Fredinandcohnia quinoae TaxID=2918902 RepID=A0AAW5E6K6_9BACI|nr:ABC transporter permease subunit [Fredinandcohnia sp. SECRCQ15]MCH1626870.1 ABC transporter permease subunit [Fredinandcohnia sp. SECRCQ15]